MRKTDATSECFEATELDKCNNLKYTVEMSILRRISILSFI